MTEVLSGFMALDITPIRSALVRWLLFFEGTVTQ
jgi:hypothetical protein